MGDSPFLHIGDSPVYLEDSMTDQTVKEIYAFLGMDFSSASKSEIDAVRRRVSRYGEDTIRKSMRMKKGVVSFCYF